MVSNQQFVKALFRGMPKGSAATFHSFMGDPSKDGRWNAMPWQYGKPLPTLNPFANNYICVSAFHAAADGKFYRRKIQFAALHAVMIDDLGTKLPMSDLKLKPSAMVETSPGNFQAWLFLELPIMSIVQSETLINEMIRAGISAEMDPGMKGVTRVARTPQGANGKKKYQANNGDVWEHRVQSTVADLNTRYTPEQIATAYGLDLTPRREAPPPAPPRTGIDIERAGLIKWLKLLGHHKAETRPGYHEIVCPWTAEHSDGAATGTYFMEPEALNSYHGGFNCHHGHCSDKDISDLVGWVRAQKESMKMNVAPTFQFNYQKGEGQ